ncbi:MAG TPA: OPT/YSL family transporter, partial [Myxococcales bacterium]|nr:OPT/YSL family transporter [Myxococcales bacterium]
KGGALARVAYQGLAFAAVYAVFQQIFKVIIDVPGYVTKATSRIFPAATVNANITPEYLGVGYIIGPRIAGVLVAGGVLAWLGIIPLIAALVPGPTIASQLVKLGMLASVDRAGAYGWNPATQTFTALNEAIYRAYVRQIGAGAVAAGGFFTLLKTLPTIVSAFKSSVASLKGGAGPETTRRTSRDLSIGVVVAGSVGLIGIMALLPFLPGTFGGRILLGFLIVVFGFFFVTVASRIVGLIGTSSNPVSGMTIATLMATCLLFVGIGWTGDLYQPMALCVGGMVCIAAANAGATSQDLKTGYLVGATPRWQQIGLLIGVVVASLVIGFTIKVLDKPTLDTATGLIQHQIGSKEFPAPQGTLMATLIRGLLAHNLDWQFVLVGVFLAATIELCGVSPLSFAVGAYLPLSTTLPIWVGGVIKGIVDRRSGAHAEAAGEDLGPGSLFATGLVAGGTVTGTIVAFLHWPDKPGQPSWLDPADFSSRITGAIGGNGYQILGVVLFAIMGVVLYRVARKPLDVKL